ncbi:helix-turn-helix transcriptional regulator [Rhodococcus sp. IEGM 1307]|nr:MULTISPECIES: helix-turn-helix transcriptional regulator [Rhodococcus]MDI9979377.1 helix-turn-helix transcriptional regulator [Rhodococcus sp. IEGM 1307]
MKRVSVSRRVLRGFDPERLIALRKSRRLGRPELARLSDVSLQTIHKWESGGQSPQIDILMRVVRALEVEVSDLVDIKRDDRYPGDWRVLLGLTQPQLGAKAGISTSMVGAIERGDARLTDNFAKKLAEALEISEEELRASFERVRTRPAGTPA